MTTLSTGALAATILSKKRPAPYTPAPPKKAEGTDEFAAAIQAHLNAKAKDDKLFAVTLKKPNKNIEECVDYIYNEVKKLNKVMFTDEEVYALAIHYYDEDNLKVAKATGIEKVVSPTKKKAA